MKKGFLRCKKLQSGAWRKEFIRCLFLSCPDMYYVNIEGRRNLRMQINISQRLLALTVRQVMNESVTDTKCSHRHIKVAQNVGTTQDLAIESPTRTSST